MIDGKPVVVMPACDATSTLEGKCLIFAWKHDAKN